MFNQLSELVAKIMAADALRAVRPGNIASRLQGFYTGMRGSETSREFAEMLEAIKGIPRDMKERVTWLAKEIDRQLLINPTTRGPWFSFRAWQGQTEAALTAAMTSAAGSFSAAVRNAVAAAGSRLQGGAAAMGGLTGLSRFASPIGSIVSRIAGALHSISHNPRVVRFAGMAGHAVGSAIRFPFAAAGAGLNAVPGAGRMMLRGSGRAVGLLSPRLGSRLVAAGSMTGAAGAAAGLGAVAAAAVSIPPILKAWGESVQESHRAISQYNGGITGAMAQADAAGIMRKIRSGAAVEPSSIRSIEAQTKLLDSLQGPLDRLTVIGNELTTFAAQTATAVSEGVKSVSVIIGMLEKIPVIGAIAEDIRKKIEKMLEDDKKNAPNPLAEIMREYDLMNRVEGRAEVWEPNRDPLPPVK